MTSTPNPESDCIKKVESFSKTAASFHVEDYVDVLICDSPRGKRTALSLYFIRHNAIQLTNLFLKRGLCSCY
jgi:hypothetical protein